MHRIEKLYREGAKKRSENEREIERHNKEMEEKELRLCTFKPKINTKFNGEISARWTHLTQEERIELLYKKGIEKIQNKTEKTKEENDYDKYKTECTFKPETHEVNYEIFDKKNSIYQDEDFCRFNQRLKVGRDEKEYKESFKERGEVFMKRRLNSECQDPLTRSQNTGNYSFVTNNVHKRSFQSNPNIQSNKKNNSMVGGVDKSDSIKQKEIFKKDSPVAEQKVEHDPNERPLLEIDVNLKHGVKKKVIVFDGDTSEKLAQSFASENGLDDKMKKKLQTLIQRELDKLLQKIPEESCSSFKSNGE